LTSLRRTPRQPDPDRVQLVVGLCGLWHFQASKTASGQRSRDHHHHFAE
jgi:uncharacterized membrane protein YuzA (DUF378 family)